MDSTRLPSILPVLDKMPPRELVALLEDARSLQRAAEAGATRPLLKARKVGLLCAADALDNDDVALLDRAAIELGAHVAHIRSDLTELSELQRVVQTAQMLGRLYDALVCQGMASGVVRRLSAEAGIPVYDGIVSPSCSLTKPSDLPGLSMSAADTRRFLLQAELLRSMT